MARAKARAFFAVGDFVELDSWTAGQLSSWTDGNVVFPLCNINPNEEGWEDTVARVKKAIREKVLQSYKNGRMTRGGNAPENLPTPRRYPVPMRQR